MASSDVTKATIFEDGDVTEMARVQANGADVTNAVVSTIARKIYDTTGNTLVGSTTLTVPSTGGGVVFDALQTDGRWTLDDDGYNFRDRVPAVNFPTPKHIYRVEYLFTGSGAEKYWLAYEHHTQEIRST